MRVDFEDGQFIKFRYRALNQVKYFLPSNTEIYSKSPLIVKYKLPDTIINPSVVNYENLFTNRSHYPPVFKMMRLIF